MTDLTALSTSGLLEDLANLRRYQKSIIARQGLGIYNERLAALVTELQRRKVALPDHRAATPAMATACRLRPLSDHVVILPDTAEAMSAGGILFPETAKEVPVQGTVLAVGPGRVESGVGTIVPAVSVGQAVLFGRYSGVTVTLDDQGVLIMREEDILGILAPKVAE